MATTSSLEARLQRLERQQSEQLRQQSAPVLVIEYVGSIDGEPTGEICDTYDVAPDTLIYAKAHRRGMGSIVGRLPI